MLDGYLDIIARKRVQFEPRGINCIPNLHGSLKPHQAHTVEFALRTGCSAAFLDTGLGKSFVALEWARVIVEHTNKPVLMLAPLAVGPQHQREAGVWGLDAVYRREPVASDGSRIVITNYERVDKFDLDQFAGVILDESSILKSFAGATTRKLISAFRNTPYRLCCSATPAPNDHMELGQHSEFLGALSQTQMLTRWFIHDSADTGKWRMKGHATRDFWDWVASWARCISKPSDIGFPDDGFELPPLTVHQHLVEADRSVDAGEDRDGQMMLMRVPNTSATSIHKEKRLTSSKRAEKVAEVLAIEPDEPWIIWVDTDYDAEAVREAVPCAMEVSGKMTPDQKEERLTAFATGASRVLLTKPSIAGMGLNFQHCARQCFAGLSFSYESYYQAIRRSYRFRQERPVHVHVVCADTEASIWDVVSRKAGDHEAMKTEMTAAMSRAHRTEKELSDYTPTSEARLPAWFAA